MSHRVLWRGDTQDKVIQYAPVVGGKTRIFRDKFAMQQPTGTKAGEWAHVP